MLRSLHLITLKIGLAKDSSWVKGFFENYGRKIKMLQFTIVTRGI